MAFSFVTANFRALIESLFALLGPTTQAPSIARAGRLATDLSAVSRGIAVPGRLSGFGGFGWVNPLRADTRQVLISAARHRHLVDLVYTGHRRLVEPYKLEYYVRKSDGHGSEYFWGFDTTGGKSGKVGIKQFFCEKIVSASESSMSFMPRFPVEL
jgi:hypothetical protein